MQAMPACGTGIPRGTPRSKARQPWTPSPARCSTWFLPMATPSRSPRPVRPSSARPAESIHHSSGGGMIGKIIGVGIATAIIYSFAEVRFLTVPFLVIALAVVFVMEGVRIVPQQNAWVVERVGKFHEILDPGLKIIVPFVDRVA